MSLEFGLWCRREKLSLMRQEFVFEENGCCGCVAVGRRGDGCKREGQTTRSKALYNVSSREYMLFVISLYAVYHSVPSVT